jgi:GldM C-terminal domain
MKTILLLLLFNTVLFAQSKKDSIPNLSVVSLEQAHILYRGLSNPIKIAVPNAKSFTATAPGLEKKDEYGNYSFNITSVPGTEVTLSIVILLNNGSYKAENQIFEIRDISRPYVVINGNYLAENAVIGLTKQELSTSAIQAGFQNLQFTLNEIDAVSFEVIWPDKTSDFIEGSKLDANALKKLKKLSVGSIITINNIDFFRGGACGRGSGPVKIVLVK